MVTMILMLKRRSGMSKEAFRDYYENGHAMMAKKYFAHLFMDYRRHYVNSTRGAKTLTRVELSGRTEKSPMMRLLKLTSRISRTWMNLNG